MSGTFLVLALNVALAAEYELEPAGSSLGFTAIQQAATFESHFDSYTASVRFDPATPGTGRIESRIALGSVDTGNPERDEVLKTADWFNHGAWPEAKFIAEEIVPAGKDFTARGTLSLRGVSRPVVLTFRWTPATGKEPARLTGKASLERLAFGIGAREWSDTSYVGNKVEVQVDVRLREVAAPPP